MAKAIMIQGTMSNAGKSLLAAGLCRIFRQDGYRVAPFKSQNMALNSFITEDGLEMGRAQVMQAEAAGIAPDVRMNPILLKPTTDTGSQVIVQGEVLGDMDARKYFAYKKSLMPLVLEAYNSLAAEYDIIVIEGAGSPAEINLKKDDIVNMGLAKAVGAPVLLAGDIDRGGVFAQLLGTQMLLEPEEQALLKGFIINKFRGDKTILDPGIAMLEERGGVPVVGVVPFMQLDIDDEDSLSPRLTQTNRAPAGKPVEIAVIRLPHLSNFTDFNVFSRIPEADLRYVSRPEALGNPDMVMLPGTKNTMADLRWLFASGMADTIDNLRRIRTGPKRAARPGGWAFWIRRRFFQKKNAAHASMAGSQIFPGPFSRLKEWKSRAMKSTWAARQRAETRPVFAGSGTTAPESKLWTEQLPGIFTAPMCTVFSMPRALPAGLLRSWRSTKV